MTPARKKKMKALFAFFLCRSTPDIYILSQQGMHACGLLVSAKIPQTAPRRVVSGEKPAQAGDKNKRAKKVSVKGMRKNEKKKKKCMFFRSSCCVVLRTRRGRREGPHAAPRHQDPLEMRCGGTAPTCQ